MKNPVRVHLSVLLAWFVLLAGAECAFAEKKPVLFAAGDTMLARWSHQIASENRDLKDVFGNVLPHIQNADLAFINLECVLSDRGALTDKYEQRPFFYRARPEMVSYLSKAGVDLACQANNHSGDYGSDALYDSMQILRSANIQTVGAGANEKEARRIRYSRLGEISVAWIVFTPYQGNTAATDEYAGVFYVPEKKILDTIIPMIAEARKNADLVIISAHWGKNGASAPSPKRRKLIKNLIDAGADMYLGHSAHSLQGMEIYKNRPILYDMGAFLFDTTNDPRLNRSMFFELTLDKNGVDEVRAYPILLKASSVDRAPKEIKDRITKFFVAASQKLDPAFRYQTREDGAVLVHLEPPQRPLAQKPSATFNVKPEESSDPGNASFDFGRKPACVLSGWKPQDSAKPVDIADGIRLLDTRIPESYFAKKCFVMSLYLSSEKNIPKNHQLLLSMRDKDKRVVYTYPHEPGDWSYPTSRWQPGEIIEDRVLMKPPADLTPGEYDIFLNISGGSDEYAKKVGSIKSIPYVKGKDPIDGLVEYGDSAANTPKNLEIYALRYASDSSLAGKTIFLGGKGSERVPVAWIVYFIRSGNRKILIDTGFRDESHRKRWGIKKIIPINDLLKKLGESTDSVTDVIITHAHADHMGNLDLFPKAKVYVQSKEAKALGRQYFKLFGAPLRTVELYNKKQRVANGVMLHHAGGHTAGSAFVEIKTKDRKFLFPSDNCYLERNCREKRYVGAVENKVDNQHFIDQFSEYSGQIVTHHDPAIFTTYPRIDENIVCVYKETNSA